MSESVIKIKIGSLVQQSHIGDPSQKQVREDRVGLNGVVINLYETNNPLASWSPLTADVMWSDGILTKGYLVSALEVVQF
jgi:hypothetical protein